MNHEQEQAPERGGYVRERLVFPILVPIISVAVLGFVALNLSRVLLASGGNKPVVIATIAAVLILAGAIFATSRESTSRGTLLGGAALSGVLLMGVGLVAQEVDADHLAEGHGGPAEAASEITSTAVDIDFREKELTASPGAIGVTLVNEGRGAHTWVVEGFEGELKLETAGGQTDEGVIELEEGEYVFYCDIPGHRGAGMEGALTVAEGAGQGGGGGGAAAAPILVPAVDIDFPEKEFTGTAGTVAFEYENQGQALHTLVVEGHESDMRIEAAGGETGTGSVELTAGEYVLYCDIPGHRGAGMEGTLTLTEGGEEAPAAERPQEEQEEQGSPPPSGGNVTVEAVDIDFPEDEYETAAGEITFEYVNEGAAFHTLVVEGREDDMKIEAQAGKTEEGTIELEPGEYVIYCDVPGHRPAGMEATLTVS